VVLDLDEEHRFGVSNPSLLTVDTSSSVVPAAMFCCFVVLKLVQFELFDNRINTIVCNT
jgi:hypothetical protein